MRLESTFVMKIPDAAPSTTAAGIGAPSMLPSDGRLRLRSSSGPFGEDFPNLVLEHGTMVDPTGQSDDSLKMVGGRRRCPMFPRDQVVVFALYTHQANVLKLSAQLYPLLRRKPEKRVWN